MTCHTALRAICALALGLLLSAVAQAQLFRTYIAPDGVDGNPCTLAAPCRLLPAALATVIDGGEIWMLGSANYNTAPVNINKSVTILAVPGALGSVVAIGGNAINIATAGVKVSLRNLVIVPFVGGGGTNGIVMTAGIGLTVENCLIANLPGTGIVVVGPTNVLVTDATIRGNTTYGLYAQNGARATVARSTFSNNAQAGVFLRSDNTSTTTADIGDSTMSANGFGVLGQSDIAGAVVKISVNNSRTVQNASAGVQISSVAGGPVTASVSNNIISNNFIGIRTFASGSKVLASGNTVSDNGTGLKNDAAVIESTGDNAVRNNTTQTSGTITPITKL